MNIRDLHFAYPDGPPVLNGASLDIPAGALACVAGANGSGKSTLLALMAGLLSPSSGRIELSGTVSPGGEAGLRARAALVLQDADLQILGATVREDLELGLAQEGRSKAMELARRLDLGGLMDRPAQTLSWGEKRKLTLASALARGPEVLLLDEPFSGLDYPGANEMRAILAANRKAGVTQVVAAHDLDPLADLADIAAVLHGGVFELWGTVSEIADRAAGFGVKPPGSGWPEIS